MARGWSRSTAPGLGLAGILILSGCAATQPRTYYNLDEEVFEKPHLAALAIDFQDKAGIARDLAAGAPLAHASAAVSQFLDAGMALTDLLCLDYFNRAVSNHQHRGFTKALLNDTNGLVSAIMGLTNAGSLATGAVGASFSYANSTAENVENSYMVSVDMAEAQALTKHAMSELANHYRKEARPDTYYDAERALADYASVCTFTGIHGLVAQSVRASQITVDKRTGAFEFNGTAAGSSERTSPPPPSPADPGIPPAPPRG